MAADVRATSPCQGDACLDETSAVLFTALEVWSRRCAEVDPAKASEYLAQHKKILEEADTPSGFLAKLRATPFYPEALADAERAFDQQSKAKQMKGCVDILK